MFHIQGYHDIIFQVSSNEGIHPMWKSWSLWSVVRVLHRHCLWSAGVGMSKSCWWVMGLCGKLHSFPYLRCCCQSPYVYNWTAEHLLWRVLHPSLWDWLTHSEVSYHGLSRCVFLFYFLIDFVDDMMIWLKAKSLILEVYIFLANCSGLGWPDFIISQ